MRSLTLKLTLAFLGVSLSVVALAAIFAGSATMSAFDRFLLDRWQADYIDICTTHYELNGSWEGVVNRLRLGGAIPPLHPTEAPGQNQLREQLEKENPSQFQLPPPPPPPSPFALIDTHNIVLVSGAAYFKDETVPEETVKAGTPIQVKGQIVGTVITADFPPLTHNPLEGRYLERTREALFISAIGAGLIALLLGILLARTITRPIRELTNASRAMTNGQLKQQVPVRSKDELGELTTTFNQMSANLEHANQLRRQMTADIAHDLRSPLTVIIGYLESLRDGVLKPTPERFDMMYSEAMQLQRLVEDLRTLSLADAGELSMNIQPTSPGDIMERLASTYQNQALKKNIELALAIEPDLPSIQVDPERIEQVLGNLLSNALRFTPDGGKISLSAQKNAETVLLNVQDNGIGIAPEILAQVFERFYRGDESRGDSGSGLGLAISKSIINLHGGDITVHSDGVECGSTFTIWLPIP